MGNTTLLKSFSVLLLAAYLFGFGVLGADKLKALSRDSEFVGVVRNLPNRFHEPMSFYELQHMVGVVKELNSGPTSAQGLRNIPNLERYLGNQPSNVDTIIASLEDSQLRLAQSQMVELAARVDEAHKKNVTFLVLQLIAGLIGCFVFALLLGYAFSRSRASGLAVSKARSEVTVEPSSPLAVAVANVCEIESVKNGHAYMLEIQGEDLIAVTEPHYALVEAMICELVCNAIVHGGRAAAIREAASKPATLKVFVGIEKVGDQFKITVADDGEGIDEIAVMKHAVAKDLVTEASLKGFETGHGVKLILLDGYSDAKPNKVGPLEHNSLASIRKGIQELGGTIALRNRPSVFCEFVLNLPI